jgi:hypothetical protein
MWIITTLELPIESSYMILIIFPNAEAKNLARSLQKNCNDKVQKAYSAR